MSSSSSIRRSARLRGVDNNNRRQSTTKTTNHRYREDTNDDDHENDPNNSSSTEEDEETTSQQQQQQQHPIIWDELRREMELVEYGKHSVTGHARRKISKADSMVRTRKRKLLEKLEAQIEEEEIRHHPKRRVRGSAAAASDAILKESLMIFGKHTKQPQKQQQQLEDEDDEEEDDDDDDGRNVEDDKNELVGGEDDNEDDDDDYIDDVDKDEDDSLGEDDEDENDEELQEEDENEVDEDTDLQEEDENDVEEDTDKEKNDKGKVQMQSKIRASKGNASNSVNRRNSKNRTRLRRLKNFKSHRMAERHGDAIGAHARGKPNLAIRKLQQVAASAPSAPQIYSSLGMVYEDMLQESQRKSSATNSQKSIATASPIVAAEEENRALDSTLAVGDGLDRANQKRVSFASDVDVPRNGSESICDENPEKLLSQQLDLAKKAYGSYHVAALLCKRDYTLWLRAGDSAWEIANLHTRAMEQQLCYEADKEAFNKFHRGEKLRWLEEAKNDYQAADNLQPPGIDIPAKLAHVMMELGMLLEALTILTDLKKNQHGGEFDASYRAWWLYADLMLRIGHECSQWNSGVLTNSNFMFRRWLRKFSKRFDWKERRLQALSKAMEAACGSQNCAKLIGWLQSRSTTWMIKESSTLEIGSEPKRHKSDMEGNNGEEENQKLQNGLSECTSVQRRSEFYEEEKEMLVQKSKSEIADFDKTTSEMNLEPDSIPMKERQSVRSVMVDNQNAELEAFAKEFRGEGAVKTVEAFDTLNQDGHHLRLSASCHSVCEISSELLRLLLDMQLYDKGKFVAEAVSQYLKERARLRDERLQRKEKLQQHQQQPLSVLAMHHEKYDDADGEESDLDSSDAAILSDDDDLDSSTEAVINSLRSGILPPELKFLYGLCLAGEGGKVYLATKCIRAVDELPQEPCSFLTEDIVDTNVSTDSVWILFHTDMTQPLGRTAAYSLIADTLRMSGKEHDFSESMKNLFRFYREELSRAGALDVVLDTKQRQNVISRHRQNKIVNILVACTKYEVRHAEVSIAKENTENRTVEPEHLLDVLESMNKLLAVVWTVRRDGSLSPACIETIRVIARALKVTNAYAPLLQTWERQSFLSDAIEQITRILSMLCNCSSIFTNNVSSDACLEDIKQMPLSCSWLSPDLKALSLRAYNACVASNLTAFSGWEANEFSTRLIRGDKNNFFGISMDDGQVTGILPTVVEEEILSQWCLVHSLLSNDISFDFEVMLSKRRQSSSYAEMKRAYEKAAREHHICEYAEDDALSILLNFSRSCLALIHECQVKGNERLLFCALSILLPISQFCLNQLLWDASMGRHTAPIANDVKNWSDFSTSASREEKELAPSRRPDYVRPCKRIRASLASGVKLYTQFDFENQQEIVSNLISVPIMTLLNGWSSLPVQDERDNSKLYEQTPSDLMKDVHFCVQRLRRCYTEHAIERASLNVSVSLLKIAENDSCQNPFLCIQQAVLFASKAPKLGTSDQPFQARLPRQKECTPKEALLILGRADCLRAVYYVHEAAFLCGYVAQISRLRRQSKTTWNIRWRIVSILAYDLSVMIRNMAGVQGAVEDIPDVWDNNVIDELEDARIDGLNWRGKNFSSGFVNDAGPVEFPAEGLKIVDAREDIEEDFTLCPGSFHDETIATALVPV